MNTKSLEPALNLNKEQANKLIQSYIEKNDPNEIFEMIINALMKSERSEFLRNQEEPNNKANGVLFEKLRFRMFNFHAFDK